MSNTVTIVIDGGLVQSVYAADSTMRVIVLDLDIEAPTLTTAHLYGPRRGARHVIESYQAMPHEEGRRLRNSY